MFSQADVLEKKKTFILKCIEILHQATPTVGSTPERLEFKQLIIRLNQANSVYFMGHSQHSSRFNFFLSENKRLNAEVLSSDLNQLGQTLDKAIRDLGNREMYAQIVIACTFMLASATVAGFIAFSLSADLILGLMGFKLAAVIASSVAIVAVKYASDVSVKQAFSDAELVQLLDVSVVENKKTPQDESVISSMSCAA